MQSLTNLHKQSIELPSDIAGLLYIPFTERVEEVKNRLFTELREAGYNPDAAALTLPLHVAAGGAE